MTTLNQIESVYYQSKSRNNGNPFMVTVIKINGKIAEVRTQGDTPVNFNCKLSSLRN